MPVEELEELDPPSPDAGVGAGVVGQLPWGIVRLLLSVAGHAEGTHSRMVLLMMKSVPAGYSVLVRAMALVRMGLLPRPMLYP
jgi:hypothetical protein